jgi:hypothetical protein
MKILFELSAIATSCFAVVSGGLLAFNETTDTPHSIPDWEPALVTDSLYLAAICGGFCIVVYIASFILRWVGKK